MEEYVNFGKLLEIWKNTLKTRKNKEENLKKKSSFHFGRKTQKYSPNSEKYTDKSGQMIQLRKIGQKYTKSGKIPWKTQGKCK